MTFFCSQLPQWLSGAMQAMRAKYPTDRFEVTLRKVNATSTPEWRIKCQDCPGKVRELVNQVGSFLLLKKKKHKTAVHSRPGRDALKLRGTFEKSHASSSCK
jgi:hypothetical protein